ncbi:MAG: prefoldin subunit alpha [Nanoarchaeota archaeon]|nr:prefoldin subunit alpha [Nanoarchaeota archaeon]MBU1854756.1 prefoldin subunit alpha [Nanoarchaeota archaeon]
MNKEKVLEYQMIEQQFQQLNANLENIEQNIQEIKSIIKVLEDFKKLKKGEKLLVPLANGIFAEATLDNSEKLKVNVGSNIVVDKNPDSAKKMMEEQIVELEKYKEETMHYYDQLYLKLQSIQQEMMVAEQEEKK